MLEPRFARLRRRGAAPSNTVRTRIGGKAPARNSAARRIEIIRASHPTAKRWQATALERLPAVTRCRAGPRRDVARGDVSAAVRAGGNGYHAVAAVAVDELDRRPDLVGHPAITPTEQRDDHRVQIAAFFGQLVLEARRPLLIADALEDAVLDELLQAVGEDMAGGAEVGLKFLEAARAQKGLAQDEQRPAIADHRQAARDRASLLADLAPTH